MHLAYAQGEVLPHRENVASVGPLALRSLVLDYSRQTGAGQSWAAAHRYPALGLSAYYNQFASPSLGFGFSLLPHLHYRFALFGSRRWYGHYHLGFGVAWLSERYDSLRNPDNQNISTPLNVAFDFRLGLNYRLNPQWHLRLQGGLLHYSNGASRLPNYGINLSQWQLGLEYRWGKAQALPSPSTQAKPWQREGLLLLMQAGRRQLLEDLQYYPVQNFNLEQNWRVNEATRLGLGLAVFNDATHQEYRAWADKWGDGEDPDRAWYQSLNAGPYLNYELVFNRFSALLQTGFYLLGAYRPFEATIDYDGDGVDFVHRVRLNRTYLFNRVGFRYCLGQHYLFNLSLKTHLFQAQYIELGIGYRL